MRTSTRTDWPEIITQAAAIVAEYNAAGTGVTLRQLFYRLVAAGALRNTEVQYRTLSARTAEARRDGNFPALVDRGRRIHRYQTFESPDDARKYIADVYRRDRTEGQETQLYVAAEKNTMVAQLEQWFGDLGVPILALGGYASQTYIDDIREDMDAEEAHRDTRLIYAGDFDPSGQDIFRDARERLGGVVDGIRIAVTKDQITEYSLTPAPGKASDPRAAGFEAEHGALIQVELEALDPTILRRLYQTEIDRHWNEDAYQRVLDLEAEERDALRNGTTPKRRRRK